MQLQEGLKTRAGQKMTPEQRERVSRAAKEIWANPEVKEKHSRAQKEAWANPELRERYSRAAREVGARPEVKERKKETWANPEVRERQSRAAKEACARPEVKERRSKAQKEAWSSPEVRIKVSGSNSPCWKGGISFEPYCPKFTRQLKDEIRAAFGYKCYLCPHIQNGKKLCIHHVDYDKNDICNGKKWPLIPLCHKCHGKTNHNRWYWFNLLMNYWAMNSEISFMEAC
jgi:hypothetical protein